MASVCDAQNLQFLGGGTSALFVPLGQAAATLIGPGACVWSQTSASTYALDMRTVNTGSEGGEVWVVWDKGSTGTDCQHPSNNFNVYSYMSMDRGSSHKERPAAHTGPERKTPSWRNSNRVGLLYW
jgi:hypothetical protein